MRVSEASNLLLSVQTTVMKKSQDVAKNEISYLLKKNMENSKNLEKAAKFLGKGINFNQKV